MSESLGLGSTGVVRALLPGTPPAASESARLKQLADGVLLPTPAQAWLMLAVLGRQLPTSDDVETAVRTARHRGTAELIASITAARRTPSRWSEPEVEVIAGAVLVDVQDTATTRVATGVQRVARAVAERWLDNDRGTDDVLLVGWSASRTRLHPLNSTAFRAKSRRGLFSRRAVAPWGGHYVLPESVNEPDRAIRIQAIAEYSGATGSMIGHDAIPLTTAETTGPRMPGVFAKYLSAASRMSVVAATSGASTTEYLGWRSMLASAGLTGPRIETVPLATSSPVLVPAAEAEARALLLVDDLPLVLVVGSHEPRKNHAAVLHASELLWRAGHRFSLTFVGGNAWNSEEFTARVEQLQAAGRPVQTLTGLSEPLLGWAYRLARFTVFPSLNEGFGLPVAESLACGIPVVTSSFGSMAEIAADGGCVLVDPRDDASLADGMRRLLEDDALHTQLSSEAVGKPPRSWEQFADDLWEATVKYTGASPRTRSARD